MESAKIEKNGWSVAPDLKMVILSVTPCFTLLLPGILAWLAALCSG